MFENQNLIILIVVLVIVLIVGVIVVGFLTGDSDSSGGETATSMGAGPTETAGRYASTLLLAQDLAFCMT